MKRKGGCLQRMAAVLLSAVLLAGTASNAFPVSAWAKESDKVQENGDGNTAETGEGSTTPEEGEPEEGTDSDGHDGRRQMRGDAEDATGAVNAANAEGATDAANGANTVYAAGTVNLPAAADMPNAVTIAEDAGTANATWNVTLRVHGYDAGKWKGIKTSHNDKIEEISQSCEEKPGQGYTDFTYTFEVNMKASTGWEQFELYYNYGGGVAKIIRKTIIIGENGWEEVNVWPVRFMNDDKVFDIIYVGEAQGINRGPETSPEKSGYTFSGWVTSDGEPAFQDDEFMQPAWIWITGETNFYASWTHTHDLVLKDAKNAACTEAGNQAYYVCNICDQWFLDAAGTQEIMNHDSVVIPAAGHSYDSSQWGYRWADGHAHKCQNCNAYDTVLPHEPGAAATETMPQTCTECGYEITPIIGHTHTYGEWQIDKEATETEAGTKHRTCEKCGYVESETIPATGGGGNNEGGDSTGGNTGSGNDGNSGGGTSGSSGSGNTSNTGNTGSGNAGNGNITPEVTVKENVPATAFATSADELAGMLLTEEEKQLTQSGTNISIILNVEDASERVEETEKALVESTIQDWRVGQYLDVSLYKQIGAERTQITETSGKIRITLAIPEGLRWTTGTGGTDHTNPADSANLTEHVNAAVSAQPVLYAILRVHNGQVELLPDLDNDADTITIETDRFSTYVLILLDKETDGEETDPVGTDAQNAGMAGGENNADGNETGSGAGGSQGAASNRDAEPKTGAGDPLQLYATLAMIAGFTYLLFYFADRRRGMTEETKKELVSKLIAWAKGGRLLRRYAALAAIFLLLVYYHGIGKKTAVKWTEVYGK